MDGELITVIEFVKFDIAWLQYSSEHSTDKRAIGFWYFQSLLDHEFLKLNTLCVDY